MVPAGYSHCSNNVEVLYIVHREIVLIFITSNPIVNTLSLSLSSCAHMQASYQCMHIDLSYLDAPPSFGDFRPLAPKYGEYKYLPPQRWLHAIQVYKNDLINLIHYFTNQTAQRLITKYM